MTTRHEFLSQLHAFLRPKVYLEIGVQYGLSLKLAHAAELAIGIDPEPRVFQQGNQQIHRATSDEYFYYYAEPDLKVDFGFIDGSHLFEDALRDFIQVESHSHAGTVVVFDDMLPTTQEMTNRIMVPGHWTGDVWKVYPALQFRRPDLHMALVNTEPTGTLVVWGLNSDGNRDLMYAYPDLVDSYKDKNRVPDTVLQRTDAWLPQDVITALMEWKQVPSDQ